LRGIRKVYSIIYQRKGLLFFYIPIAYISTSLVVYVSHCAKANRILAQIRESESKDSICIDSLQLIHPYWLTADVVIQRITRRGPSVPQGSPLFIFFIIIDYVEIPALVAGLTYYALSIYKHEKNSTKNSLLLSTLAIQVFHIFWITDEVVYDSFFGSSSRSVEISYYAV